MISEDNKQEAEKTVGVKANVLSADVNDVEIIWRLCRYDNRRVSRVCSSATDNSQGY